MPGILIAVYVATGLCLVDALRRPEGQWAHADKDKSYWVLMLVLSAVVVLPAPIFVPAYLLGVLPKFSGAARAERSDPFAK